MNLRSNSPGNATRPAVVRRAPLTRSAAWRRCLLALLLIVVGACRHDAPAAGPLLNSERIQQRYGSYGVRLLRQEGNLRVACLFSVETQGEVCRTLAVTLLDPPAPGLVREFSVIEAGASIGATLKAAGWNVVKRNHVITERATQPGFAAWLSWPEAAPPPRVAVDVYALWAERPGDAHRFARIAEVHHPDYLNVHALRQIIPPRQRAPTMVATAYPELDAWLETILAEGPVPDPERNFPELN